MVEQFLNFSSFTTSIDVVSFVAIFTCFLLVVMFTLFYDHKLISRGIRNLSTIELTWDKYLGINILGLLISYVFITWYAILMAKLLIYPFITWENISLSSDQILIILLTFILSSGVIVRYIYVLSSTAFGSVLWDFYAIPGIFVTIYCLIIRQPDFPSLQATLELMICACVIGIVAEVGLIYFRRNLRNVFERNQLHEILELIPLKSIVISGRNELYANLATIIKEGIFEQKKGRVACGSSVYFERDNEGKYDDAVKSFIGEGEGKIRYVGPLTQQSYEDDENWEEREKNIQNRKKLKIELRDYPLSFDSFRFLIVNQRHVSIEFPMQLNPISLQKHTRSVIAISFENGVIASMFQALFDVMWNNAEENVENNQI